MSDIQLVPTKITDLTFLSVQKKQRYNPIYSIVTQSSIENGDNLVLNHRDEMVDIDKVVSAENQIHHKPTFIKYSPLLDPLRYLLGKYDSYGEKIRDLPKSDESTIPKLATPHNSSYVDSFFYYLSSELGRKDGFVHSVDFYGSYLGIHPEFPFNAYDDIDYLQSNPVFFQRLNKTFVVDASYNQLFDFYRGLPANTRRFKEKLTICDEIDGHSITIKNLDKNPSETTDLIAESELAQEQGLKLEYERNADNHHKTESTLSSDDSEVNYSTEEEDTHDEEDKSSESDWETESDESEEDIDETLILKIKDFPCQMICLEKCDGTIDELFSAGDMDQQKSVSCVFQIIMILLKYQKAFSLTHNDLHTNNVMYIKTDITHLVYHYSGKTYKVPTFGRIFKIIDFGRSIYTVPIDNKPITLCSDSFAKGGDGYSQYNFRPTNTNADNGFYNKKKPEVLPNPSFDLCRLGCSMFDFLMNPDSPFDELDAFQQLIYTWCLDDNGKNVLYKKTGEERYPNFKLYKMIARTVHRHTPENQLSKPIFM